jgi:hypothetical protein
MKEIPILFADPMVRAILDGRKTQTRRLVNFLQGFGPVTEFDSSTAYEYDWQFRNRRMLWNDIRHDRLMESCPWQPGDVLWVRECWATVLQYGPYSTASITYRADNACQYVEFEHVSKWVQLSGEKNGQRWRPSIHMPRWACRLFLDVTRVRCERLQSISEADARAEGIIDGGCLNCGDNEPCDCAAPKPSAVESFICLWDSLYGKRPGCDWAANPWVFVIEFEKRKG